MFPAQDDMAEAMQRAASSARTFIEFRHLANGALPDGVSIPPGTLIGFWNLHEKEGFTASDDLLKKADKR